MNGYMGKMARVDLSIGAISHLELAPSILKDYIGGSSLGARLLFDWTSNSTEPLGPDNPLIFLTGPLVGTSVPTSGRHAVVSESPRSTWGEADVGGSFGAALKSAGFDGIAIIGASDKPVYIAIIDGEVAIRDARSLWGLDTYQTDARLKAAISDKASISCIGPAGENMLGIASILSDGVHGRAAGRCGLGAVMGSKKLKAIVSLGSRRPGVAKPEELKKMVKKLAIRIKAKTENLKRYGTAGGVLVNAELGDMPIMNWRKGLWDEGMRKISGQTMAETILVGRYYCRACTIGCGRVVKTSTPQGGELAGAGPEYESAAGFGSLCLNDDLASIAAANELCNRYGLDVISTASAIAFAMEAFEKGHIGTADTDGLELRWGDSGAIIGLIHKIGRNEGLGATLGKGVREASSTIGKGSGDYALEVKGLELPFHDPRALSSFAIAYATHPRGACHRGCTHYLERFPMAELGFDSPLDRRSSHRKAEASAKAQDLGVLYNSMKLCQFIIGAVKPSEMLRCLELVTGWEMGLDDFFRCGERGFTLMRLFNLRLGMARADDSLPKRILTEKLAEGGAAGYLPPLAELLKDYYSYRGWDERGAPIPSKLKELGLEGDMGQLPNLYGGHLDSAH